MCGISGIVSLKDKPVHNAEARVRHMNALMYHRGPDSSGIYISPDKRVAFGNTRLAISDPFSSLPQPLCSSDGQMIMNFNGELYNDLELRDELEGRGVTFRSHMDTEVLLEGLRLHGEDFLHRIDGMWAFALYDIKKKTVLFSRDVLGERHLFYRITEDEFIFASEVGPIIAASPDSLEISIDEMVSAFRFGAARPGRTLFQGIERMLSGHNILLCPGQRPQQYRHRILHPEKWDDFFAAASLDQAVDKFEEVFHLACRRRVPRDVPYISTLSGGIDSGLVAYYVSDKGGQKIDTIFARNEATLLCLRGGDMPEYEASLITSGKIHSRHHVVNIDTENAADALNYYASHAFTGLFDEAGASFEMLGHGGRAMGKKVMLISDGPDEFSGGYSKDLLDWLENGAQKNGAEYLRPFHGFVSDDTMKRVLSAHTALLDPVFGTVPEAYSDVARAYDRSQRRALMYASTSIPDYCNLRSDTGFMRASVEARSPYLAPQMAEFLIAMPGRLRYLDGASTKAFLREIVRRRISPVLAARGKYPFSAPLWFNLHLKKAIKFDETIRDSKAWEQMPFSKEFRENIFDEQSVTPFYKLRWGFFCLTRTIERARSLQQGGE